MRRDLTLGEAEDGLVSRLIAAEGCIRNRKSQQRYAAVGGNCGALVKVMCETEARAAVRRGAEVAGEASLVTCGQGTAECPRA